MRERQSITFAETSEVCKRGSIKQGRLPKSLFTVIGVTDMYSIYSHFPIDCLYCVGVHYNVITLSLRF